MEYFKKYFKDVDNWEQEEVKVICPFHNDTNPSASINTSNSLFHCWVCDIGYNEEQFVARVNNISKTDAIKLLDKYNSYDKWETHKGLLWADTDFLEKVKKLGFSENLIEEMQLGLIKDENNLSRKYLGIPVYYNNILVDIRRYNINKYENVPKMMSNAGAISGWVIPYDKFLNTLKSRSIYNFGIDVTSDDKILTLSTCDNTGTKRVAVHAKMINIEYK